MALRVARERRGRSFAPALVDALVNLDADHGFWTALAEASLDRALVADVLATESVFPRP